MKNFHFFQFCFLVSLFCFFLATQSVSAVSDSLLSPIPSITGVSDGTTQLVRCDSNTPCASGYTCWSWLGYCVNSSALSTLSVTTSNNPTISIGVPTGSTVAPYGTGTTSVNSSSNPMYNTNNGSYTTGTGSSNSAMYNTNSGAYTTGTGFSRSATPVLTFSATNAQIPSGGSVTLTWASDEMSVCSAASSPINEQWSGVKGISGLQAITDITANTTFSLVCSGSGGSITEVAPIALINPSTSTPVIPTNPSPADKSTVDVNIDFSWANTVSSGGWYNFYYKKNNDSTWTEVSKLNTYKYSLSNLSFGITYDWKVKACNSESLCSESSAWKFTTASSTTSYQAETNQLQNQVNYLLSQITQLQSQLAATINTQQGAGQSSTQTTSSQQAMYNQGYTAGQTSNTPTTNNQQATYNQPQLAGTNSDGSWCYTFTKSLAYNDVGYAVGALQAALQKEGLLNVSKLTTYFGPVTENAVTAFQNKYRDDILAQYNLTSGTGFVGPATIEKLNELYGCK